MSVDRVFLDTGAFIAVIIPSDKHHAAIQPVWNRLQSPGGPQIVTTAVVLHEISVVMRGAYRRLRDQGAKLPTRDTLNRAMNEAIRAIALSSNVHIEPVERADVVAALDESDAMRGRVSLVDALSFAVMRRLNIRRFLGTDIHDFTRAGFLRWPSES